MKIQENAAVVFDYELFEDGGELIDHSEPGDPFRYTHGQGEIVPGLERELAGMEPGEKKEVVVTPDDGYGHADENLVFTVDKEELPAGFNPAAGMVVETQGPQGQKLTGIVADVAPEQVTIDFNHPLAGKTLRFKVTVLEVQGA